jgi:uncharacterized membrane protein YfcA
VGLFSTSAKNRKANLEILLGMLGFFTAAAFVTAAIAELQGKSAIKEVLVLVGFLAAFYVVYRAWRKSVRKADSMTDRKTSR